MVFRKLIRAHRTEVLARFCCSNPEIASRSFTISISSSNLLSATLFPNSTDAYYDSGSCFTDLALVRIGPICLFIT